MNEIEARSTLAKHIDRYRGRSYEYLATFAHLGRTDTSRVGEPGGEKYQIDVKVTWENNPNGKVRIKGSIQDAANRAGQSIVQSFAKSPSGDLEEA